jgi:hypothetical protein
VRCGSSGDRVEQAPVPVYGPDGTTQIGVADVSQPYVRPRSREARCRSESVPG